MCPFVVLICLYSSFPQQKSILCKHRIIALPKYRVFAQFNCIWHLPNRLGATWEGDQELNTHPSAIISMNEEESGYFERLGARTETILERFFTVWGTYCASRPWFVLFCGKLNKKHIKPIILLYPSNQVSNDRSWFPHYEYEIVSPTPILRAPSDGCIGVRPHHFSFRDIMEPGHPWSIIKLIYCYPKEAGRQYV